MSIENNDGDNNGGGSTDNSATEGNIETLSSKLINNNNLKLIKVLPRVEIGVEFKLH